MNTSILRRERSIRPLTSAVGRDLLLCMVVAVYPLLGCGPQAMDRSVQESRLVHKDSQGKLKYEPINELGDILIDYSNVGYMGGGVKIPDATVRITLEPITGSTDDWQRIQAAIDSLSKLPPDGSGLRGAVLLKRGRYRSSRVLTIGASGIVLRGEGNGPDGTCLVDDIKEKNNFVVVSGSGSLEEIPNTRVDIADEYVPVGAHSIHVSDGSGFSAGDKVCVYRPATHEWLHTLGTDSIPKDFPQVRDWTTEQYNLHWERTIVSINGNEIILDAPIVDALNKELGKSYLYRYNFGGRISQVGVENIRLESYFDPAIKSNVRLELIREGLNGSRAQGGVPQNYADENHGWAAVEIASAENCWARNITSRYFGYSCVKINSSAKYVTVQDCEYLDPVSLVEGGRRYSFYVNGQLNLVQRCYARGGRHDFVLASRTRGPNVFFDCSADQSWSATEAHHRWSQGALWDNVVTMGPWNCMQAVNRSSSGTGHGWAAVNMVFWNCDAKFMFIQQPPTGQNFLIGRKHTKPYVYLTSYKDELAEMMKWIEFHAKKTFTYAKGATAIGDGYIEYPNSLVSPKSLYLEQLKERLGMQAVQNIATAEQMRQYLQE